MIMFDHLAIAANSLEEGVAFAEAAFGVPMGGGGQHPRMATHNRLLNAGHGRYIEVIAPDPAAPPPDMPRWFGLDRPPASPAILSWIVRGVPEARPVSLGTPAAMSRGALHWTITFPADGSLTMDGALPALIEWPAGVHPTQTMPESGVVLERLIITHPQIGRVAEVLEAMGFSEMALLDLRAGPARLGARFITPGGMVEI